MGYGVASSLNLNPPVITATSVLLPPAKEPRPYPGDELPSFTPLLPQSSLGVQLDDRIRELSGTTAEIAYLDAIDAGREASSLRRRDSRWLYLTIKNLLTTSGLDPRRADSGPVALANCLLHLGFSGEAKANPASFKVQLEHQTPACLAEIFGMTGPQFLVRQGDNSDLLALDLIASSGAYQEYPTVLTGIATPHPLLARIETLCELEAEAAGLRPQGPGHTPRYTEGAAAILVESDEHAKKRKAKVLGRILATYQCLGTFDRRDPAQWEHHLEVCLDRLRALCPNGIGAARLCDRANRWGDLGTMSGLVDIGRALGGLSPGSEGRDTPILIYEMSKAGNFAGVMIVGSGVVCY